MPSEHTCRGPAGGSTWRRPGTLAEAVRLSSAGGDLNAALREFLDEFYLDREAGGRLARILEEPPLLGDAFLDAYVGAAAEHLHSRWRLPEPRPAWVDRPERDRLRALTFMPGEEAMKPFRLGESPPAFRRRLIFTEADPMRRPSMPKDATFWYFEEMRTGIPRPPDGEDDPERAEAPTAL
jgi:hypothetical protein